MKRKIAMLMVSVLTVLTLAACGSKENTDTSTSTSTSINTEAPVAAEPIESVAEESVVTEPSVEQATGLSVIEYESNLDRSTAEKYNLELGYSDSIVLDDDTPTEVLEALLDEEELGRMHFVLTSEDLLNPDSPEYRQEIVDVLAKNEELKYSNN